MLLLASQKIRVDGIGGGVACGGIAADEPAIDGKILLNIDYGLQLGHRCNVRVISVDEYDL